jgi:hypothetical protein
VTLEPAGDRTLLTLAHAWAPDLSAFRPARSGWHVHPDFPVRRVAGHGPQAPLWDGPAGVRAVCARRIDSGAARARPDAVSHAWDKIRS